MQKKSCFQKVNELDQTALTSTMEAYEMGLTLDDQVENNLELQKELEGI